MINKIKSCYHWFKETWFGIGWLGYGFLYVWEKLFSFIKDIFCYMCKKIQDNLIGLSIIISCIIALSCGIGVYYFVEIPNDASFSITKYSSLIRNLLLGLIALISFPFLVWRTILASQQEKTTNKQADTALKVRIDKLYNDAVTQLSNDKETIRLASILTFQELLNTSDDNDFRKKIVDILWLFMVEHSREIFEVSGIFEKYQQEKDRNSPEYIQVKEKFEKQEKNIKTYHSQFKKIIEILTEYRDTLCNDAWWKDKSMSQVWLREANLKYAKFAYAHLQDAQLQYAELQHAELQYAHLQRARLQNSRLMKAQLCGTDLQNVNLSNSDLKDANLIESLLTGAILKNAEYNSELIKSYDNFIRIEPTQFPDGFNPKEHGMIDAPEQIRLLQSHRQGVANTNEHCFIGLYQNA